MLALGQEQFGPPTPTITQQATQAVVDIDRAVEESTGISNIAYYIGIGLIGYVAYAYMTSK